MNRLASFIKRIKRSFFTNTELPEQWRKIAIKDLPLLALDLELTSLEQDAEIVSVGWVSCEHQAIQLSSAFHSIISTDANLHQSPTIHGLTNEDIVAGADLKEVLEKLFVMANSHIWVFHNALIDYSAIKRACTQLDIEFPDFVYFDTLQMERYLLEKKQHPIVNGALTLKSCRHRYGLEEAPAHNALDDAMATIELALVQLHQFSPKGNEELHQLIRTKALHLS